MIVWGLEVAGHLHPVVYDLGFESVDVPITLRVLPTFVIGRTYLWLISIWQQPGPSEGMQPSTTLIGWNPIGGSC